jgi:hypothetical protein
MKVKITKNLTIYLIKACGIFGFAQKLTYDSREVQYSESFIRILKENSSIVIPWSNIEYIVEEIAQ